MGRNLRLERVDREGFLLVDQQLRCSGNYGQDDVGPVFAGGDIATVLDHPRPKAGVFAVMAGMVLWINLRATLRSEKLVTYWPQQSFLGLLNLGDGSCIASRGSLGAQGEWLWGLKDWIDRRWMWNYCQGLPEMPTAEPPASAALGSGRRSGELLSLLRKSAMRCGGCGAKVGATTLAQAMARCSSYIPRQPERGEKAQVVVGAGDDAAVVDFFHEANGKISTVQSIDFFRSFVEDPFVMGQVAAFHALSDLEAMGASALSAMALAQVPFAMEERSRRRTWCSSWPAPPWPSSPWAALWSEDDTPARPRSSAWASRSPAPWRFDLRSHEEEPAGARGVADPHKAAGHGGPLRRRHASKGAGSVDRRGAEAHGLLQRRGGQGTSRQRLRGLHRCHRLWADRALVGDVLHLASGGLRQPAEGPGLPGCRGVPPDGHRELFAGRQRAPAARRDRH
ncbi:unnamed protein product [Effrenium voratum]|nr:unnamed protein product [Effrenium voratum]